MIRRGPGIGRRRGMAAVESAVVYPVVILLVLGTIIMGLGIFRFQQLQSLAREGARYASVHGPEYAAATGNSQASSSSVLSYLEGMAVGLNGLNCTAVTYSPAATMPCIVTVTLTYTWTPGAFFNSMTWTVSSTMPVSY